MSGKKSEKLMDKWHEIIYKKLKDSDNFLQISEQFSELPNDEARVQFSWKLDCIQETVKVKEMYLEKSSVKSVQARTNGNQAFQNRNFNESLKLYNESVHFAPWLSSEHEFPMAVANRSAVLFHTKKFNECLQDIELSLSHSYPEYLRYKIYERQGKCYYFLHRPTEALQSFIKAETFLPLANMSAEKQNLFAKGIDSWIKKSKQNSKPLGAIKAQNTHVNTIPDLTNGPTIAFPSLSAKLDVAFEPGKGRFIKAVEQVQVGEVLTVEKPYASVLLPENYSSHCLHCLKRVLAPVPCRQCARVRFCSEACEKLAWSYHRYECKYLDFLKACDIGKFGFLALRVITRTTWDELKHFDSECLPEARDDDTSGIYGNSYFEIYHLVAHSEHRSTSDLFRRSIMAILLAKCLQGAGFLEENLPPDRTTHQILYVGGHLLRMLQVLPCNAHEISEFQQLDNDLVNSHTVEIAAAIYATFSLFNHSCDPSVTRNFYGDTCVMRSIQTISKGEEIAENYGYVSAVTPLKERKAELTKQYYFDCTCGACREAWPLYADLESRIPILKCRSCGEQVPSDAQTQTVYQCSRCSQKINVQAMFNEVYDASACLKVGIDKMVEGDDKAALPQLLACIERLDHCVKRPWQDINACQQAIIQCYNVLQSNRYFIRK